MLKKFSLWLEEREKERRIRKQIFDRMGFNSEIDPSTVKIKGLKMLAKAVDELGIEDENTVEELKNWILNNPGATLTQFLTQIDPDDVPDDEDMPGDAAQLPPEQDSEPSANQGQMPPVPPDGSAPPPAPDMGGSQLPTSPPGGAPGGQKPMPKKPPMMGM